MISKQNNIILRYELLGILLISILGGLLHFTFEISGFNPVIGIFSAVNESVWEHLKLGFWPIILLTIIEYRLIRKQTTNFFLGKTISALTIITVIPVMFYSYTSLTGESIFLIDISSFFISVIIGQTLSYMILTHKQLSKNLEWLSIALLILLAILFVVFTFYPPNLPPFQDPISGDYGRINQPN